MTELLADYAVFLLKTATVVVAVLFLIAASAAASRRASGQDRLEVENLNKKYRRLADALCRVVMSRRDWKTLRRDARTRDKAVKRARKHRPRTFVIDFKGDLRATAVASLREEVSAILEVAGETDNVVLRLENHGGVVHEHGLAASQLVRLRERNVPLIVAVDKVAASGGYLMACVANRIVAAPFAVLGSIGVIAQMPNFNRMMDSHGIEYEQVTAGEFKRTVTMFGKNTDEHRARLREQLEDVHALFKAAVATYRPGLDLASVATGEHWYGSRALELGLADELRTSDALLAELARERDLYRIAWKIRKPLQKRLLANVDGALDAVDAAAWRQRFESRLPR